MKVRQAKISAAWTSSSFVELMFGINLHQNIPLPISYSNYDRRLTALHFHVVDLAVWIRTDDGVASRPDCLREGDIR